MERHRVIAKAIAHALVVGVGALKKRVPVAAPAGGRDRRAHAFLALVQKLSSRPLADRSSVRLGPAETRGGHLYLDRLLTGDVLLRMHDLLGGRDLALLVREVDQPPALRVPIEESDEAGARAVRELKLRLGELRELHVSGIDSLALSSQVQAVEMALGVDL